MPGSRRQKNISGLAALESDGNNLFMDHFEVDGGGNAPQASQSIKGSLVFMPSRTPCTLRFWLKADEDED